MALEIDAYWVPTGHVIGVDAKVGEKVETAFAFVRRRTFSQWPDFSLGSIAASDSSSWTEIKSGDTYILDPNHRNIVYHNFYGSYPVNMRVFEQMENVVMRQIRGLVGKDLNRGYIGGMLNEPNNPTPKTEFATIRGLTTRKFAAYNPQSASITGYLNFFIGQYAVKWITSRRLVNQYKSLEKRFTPLSLGDAQYVPTAPEWLKSIIEGVR